ncbi:MAG: hypothetical protein D6782_01165 [Alphaproteobacteria bacterium]|nr:MAG: hypothetical protein D6782_01165 [Alphaproteobacteria bacterium]
MIACLLAGFSLRMASAADATAMAGQEALAPALVAGLAAMRDGDMARPLRTDPARAQTALAVFLLALHAGCGRSHCSVAPRPLYAERASMRRDDF